jgi:hypothetical protein
MNRFEVWNLCFLNREDTHYFDFVPDGRRE